MLNLKTQDAESLRSGPRILSHHRMAHPQRPEPDSVMHQDCLHRHTCEALITHLDCRFFSASNETVSESLEPTWSWMDAILLRFSHMQLLTQWPHLDLSLVLQMLAASSQSPCRSHDLNSIQLLPRQRVSFYTGLAVSLQWLTPVCVSLTKLLMSLCSKIQVLHFNWFLTTYNSHY